MDETSNQTPRGTSDHGFDVNRPTIISLLYLGGYLTGGLSGLVGIVLAHIWRSEDHDAWMTSHYTYLIRTFWIGLIATVVGVILSIVLIGIPIIIAACVWIGVRSVMSLIKAQKQEPIPEPETLLF